MSQPRGGDHSLFRSITTLKGYHTDVEKVISRSTFKNQDCDATFLLCQMSGAVFSRRIWILHRFLNMLASGFFEKILIIHQLTIILVKVVETFSVEKLSIP